MIGSSASARPLLVLGLAGLLATSCSAEAPSSATPRATTTPSTAPSTAPPSAAPAEATSAMTITGFQYDVPATVSPGELVTVVNEDREAHTVTVDGGAVRLTVPGGGTATFAAPAEVGEHTVVCDLHGGMDAVLVVA